MAGRGDHQTTDPVLARALSRRHALRACLGALVACPSVGADPAQAEGMEVARRLIEARLVEMGFVNLRRLQSGDGQPAIHAERLDAPGRPTLLVYAHYDVQPPEPLSSWHSPPFAATERDGRLYGRGASDDKGPMLIALEALAAFLEVEGRLPVNVKLLIEGEEETGSVSLPGLLAENRELLAADAVLSADGARWRPDIVSLNTGSRGNSGFEIRVRTAGKDLHSGRYGGVVPNALHVMSRLVASLHDDQGRIAAPGFHDGVAGPSPTERQQIAAIPVNMDAHLADIGTVPAGESGFSTLERLWLRPALDVNGMWGGHTGAGAKTVIPCEAGAKITMRLVPGQTPEVARDAVLAHLHAQLPAGARLEVVEDRGSCAAYAVPAAHPLLAAAEGALETTTGTRPRHVRIGASLPLTSIVAETLGLDTVMFSFATSDEDFHAPNEFLRLDAIDEGLAAWIEILRRVGAQTPDTYAPFRGRVS